MLRSDRAIAMSVYVIRAFIELRVLPLLSPPESPRRQIGFSP
jgi:hypothetical protein